MSDTNTVDPLAMTGDAPDVTFPLLSEGIREMNFSAVEPVKFEGKDGKPDSEAVKIIWSLLAKDKDTEGGPLNVGFPVQQLIFTTPNEQNSADAIKAEIGMVIKACLGRAEAKGKTLRDCIGKVAKVKIGLFVSKKNGKEYNTVKVIVPKE